jgi:CNT family concentrative nucleoside transporter
MQDAPPLSPQPTPLAWRLAIAGTIAVLGAAAYLLREVIGVRGQALAGVFCFFGVVALFSANLRAVNWRTIGWGVVLQFGLALFILKFAINGLESVGIPDGYRPGFELFKGIGTAITKFVDFADQGARFVFGPLADPETLRRVFGDAHGFVFAFSALPAILFVSSFFAVLYYFGVLQFIVRVFAKAMMYLMGTSGAETLSATANVFMGQTEAPLIVKPYVARMTQSELLTLMVGGMATISGGVMVVYVRMGADPVAILATSVMAAPCALYLSKLLLPELEKPQTSGAATVAVEVPHRNVIDAAAAGASDGMALALNVAAMLIAFIAFIALIDYLLGLVHSDLSLKMVFSKVFAPAAFLMGVESPDVPAVADLLGIKLAGNEFLAYMKLTTETGLARDARAFILSTFALTGFANFASVGIQLGGIGAMAPERRHDLAKLGGRALFVGFVATLLNAAIAGVLL